MIGQIYTPISLLKKIFRIGERSLSRQEIVFRLQQYYQLDEAVADETVQSSLDITDSPFREGNSKAIIEYVQESQSLAAQVHRILNEAGGPLTEDQILRKLRSQNYISWSFPFERLGLLGDHRFVQLKADQRWMLSDWDIVNDEAYQYLSNHGTTELQLRDIPYMLQMKLGLSKKKGIFLPEFDPRFKVEETKLFILQKEEKQESTFPIMQELDTPDSLSNRELDNTSFMEVAAAMSQETLEIIENEKSTVVDEVLKDLTGALIKLEKRAGEMKDEVVSHFTSNNLEAIKSLMDEKEKNEKVLIKLKEIVDELS